MPIRITALVIAPVLSPVRLWSIQETSEPPEQEQVRNDVVVVSAPRMEIPLNEAPAATTVVPQEILKAMPRRIAADEALRFVPELKVDNQANGETVRMAFTEPDPDGNSYQPGPKGEIFVTGHLYLGRR